MCGIVGLYSKKEHITKEQFATFLSILESTEIRGDDATGISYIEDGKIVIIKEALKASEFVKKIEPRDLKTKILIGHCRKKTQGHESNPLNNHPILYDDLSLVHNGWVYNDDDVFKDHKLTRHGQVDSEAIVALIKHNFSGTIPDAVEKAHKELKGAFACLMISDKAPENLFLWKTTNPAVFKETDDGFYISSTADILNKSILEGIPVTCPVYDMFIFKDNKYDKIVNKIPHVPFENPRKTVYTRTDHDWRFGNNCNTTYTRSSTQTLFGYKYEKGFFS